MRRLSIKTLGLACGALACAFLLTGCPLTTTFGGASTSTTTGTANATVAGIWSGTDSSGDPVTGLVDDDGSAVFVDEGIQYEGSLQIDGSDVEAALDGYPNFPDTFSDLSTEGVGSLSGSVSATTPTTTTTLTATLTFNTSGGTPIDSTWTLTYDGLSTAGSSLSAISGNYTDTASGVQAVVSISTAGVLTGTAADGCVLNGTVTTDSATYDIYQISFTYGDCTGSNAVLNGVAFRGLALLDTALSPYQLQLVVSGQSPSTAVNYGLTYALNQD